MESKWIEAEDEKRKDVISYNAPGSERINICRNCEKTLKAMRDWPRDHRGVEYCQVSYGLHEGYCCLCQPIPGDQPWLADYLYPGDRSECGK